MGESAIVLVIVVISLISILVAVLFLLSLQKCLGRISPHNREMSPGLVWLNLIPIFNLFWLFYTIIKIAASVRKEGTERGVDVGDGGKGVGLGYAICSLLAFIPYIGILLGLVGLVLWIVYWVKISGYSATFERQVAPVAG